MCRAFYSSAKSGAIASAVLMRRLVWKHQLLCLRDVRALLSVQWLSWTQQNELSLLLSALSFWLAWDPLCSPICCQSCGRPLASTSQVRC